MPPPALLSPWWVVVPIKGGPGAKSRLVGPPGFAAAIAGDTLAAIVSALGPERVVVVTSDAASTVLGARLGAALVADPGAGLDAAVAAGLAWVRAIDPGGLAAVLLGDRPALRAEDLTGTLHAASELVTAGCGVLVPDHTGLGTALLADRVAAPWRTAFGPGSAARHRDLGWRPLAGAPERLRLDVDDAEDLARAAALGLGPRTNGLVSDPGRSTA